MINIRVSTCHHSDFFSDKGPRDKLDAGCSQVSMTCSWSQETRWQLCSQIQVRMQANAGSKLCWGDRATSILQ